MTPPKTNPPPSHAPTAVSRIVSLVVLLALIALFGGLFYMVVARFIVPLFLAAMLTVLFRPMHQWIISKCGRYDRIAAGVTTAAILLIVLLPTAGIIYKAASDAVHLVHGPGEFHFNDKFDNFVAMINSQFGLQLDPGAVRHDVTEKINTWLGPIAARAPGFVFDFILGFFVHVLALYYFLADGREFMATLMRLIPLDANYQQRLVGEFEEVSRAVVAAHLLAGLAQSILAGIGFYFCGLGSVFLLMLLTFLGSMIPFVGAASVWISAALWLFFVENRHLAGILLALYGVSIISMVDNVLKPIVLHGRSKLNPLLAVLSVLGGVQALGPIGIFVGPMAVAFLQAGLNMLHGELTAMREVIE
ncbi:MAG: AI-2E family transporter [Pirellulales bacterium]|nr:AI-2E family transporter [Pirellulales bacterium]